MSTTLFESDKLHVHGYCGPGPSPRVGIAVMDHGVTRLIGGWQQDISVAEARGLHENLGAWLVRMQPRSPVTPDPRITDEYIRSNCCGEKGCTNWAAEGYIYCIGHLHGPSREMPPDVAARKLELEGT